MGLDLALVGLVLVAAIRGWLKGFVVQAVRLGALVGSAYAAVPVRDQVKPYALQYLPTIRPDLVDRLLWWSCAVASYVLLVAVASFAVAVSRRQAYALGEPARGDQFAGFGLGLIKGLILAAFLVAALHKYGESYLGKFEVAAEQTKESQAWKWNAQYHPAGLLWASPPVRHFVAHVQKMGIRGPAERPTVGPADPGPPVQTASRAPKLEWGGPEAPVDALGGEFEGLDHDLAAQLDRLREQLKSLPQAK